MGAAEQMQILMLKGAISEMSPESQAKVNDCHKTLVETIKPYGDEGLIALSLLGLQLADKTDE